MPATYLRTENNKFDFSGCDGVRETNRRLNAMLRGINLGYLIPHLTPMEKKELFGGLLYAYSGGRLSLAIPNVFDQLMKLSGYSNPADQARYATNVLGELLAKGPFCINMNYYNLFTVSDEVTATGKLEGAVSALEYLATQAKKGGGTLILPCDTYKQLYETTEAGLFEDASQIAIEKLGRILSAGLVDVHIGFKEVYQTTPGGLFTNVGEKTINRIGWLSEKAEEGGGAIVLPSNTLRQMADAYGQSRREESTEWAVSALGRIIAAGSAEAKIDFAELRDGFDDQYLSSRAEKAVNRLEWLASQTTIGLQRQIQRDSEAFRKQINEELKKESQKDPEQQKSLQDIVKHSFATQLTETSKNKSSIIKLHTKTYFQLVDSSGASTIEDRVSEAMSNLEGILEKGTVELGINVKDLYNTTTARTIGGKGSQVTERLIRLVEGAWKGGGIIRLSPQTYSQMAQWEAPIDVLQRMVEIYQYGPLDLSINMKEVIDTMPGNDQEACAHRAVQEMKNLAYNAKIGILTPVERKIEKINKEINACLESNEQYEKEKSKETKKARERKPVEEIAQETHIQIHREFAKKRTSVLRLNQDTFNQLYYSSGAYNSSSKANQAIEWIGQILESGPVEVPLNHKEISACYSQGLFFANSSNLAFEKIKEIGEKSRTWSTEYHQKLSELHWSTCKLELLKENYTIEEIEGSKESDTK